MSAAKRTHFHRAVTIAVGASVMIMVASTIALNTLTSPGRVLGIAASPTPIPALSTADYQLTVGNVSSAAIPESAGQQRVTIKLKLENLTSRLIQVSPGLQMFLRTNDSHQYNMTAQFLEPGAVLGGPLEAHGSTDLSVDFVLPSDASPSEFIYQPDAATAPGKVRL